MDIKNRITICRLLNKVNDHKEFAKQVGIKDATYFKGTEQSNTKTSVNQNK